MADFALATECLEDNLQRLGNPNGSVSPENAVMWNVTTALQVVCEALQDIQRQVRQIKR